MILFRLPTYFFAIPLHFVKYCQWVYFYHSYMHFYPLDILQPSVLSNLSIPLLCPHEHSNNHAYWYSHSMLFVPKLLHGYNVFVYYFLYPVATCQGRIHHFSSLFLDFPCFPCSKSWRMTRSNLSSTLWVLVAEKCTSAKYLVLSIFCCKQGVNRPVVWMLSLMFLLLGVKKTHGLQFTVPCAFTLLIWYEIVLLITPTA